MPAAHGKCHICGRIGPLSYEHVPPRAAYNDKPILLSSFEDIRKRENASGDLDSIKGRIKQRGMGDYTLCGKCNSDTGAWYGHSYVAWAQQGMELAKYTAQAPSLGYTFRIHPLQVLKQIVCIFLSANGGEFADKHADLVKFVLDKRAQFINPTTRIYAYYSLSGRVRKTGVAAAGSFDGGPFRVISEFAFVPFGYLMTFNSEPPDNRLCDITGFNRFSYDDWQEIYIRLAILPIYTYFPGDYRDKATVLQQIQQSRSVTDR
jgi:hypothetical protein